MYSSRMRTVRSSGRLRDSVCLGVSPWRGGVSVLGVSFWGVAAEGVFAQGVSA